MSDKAPNGPKQKGNTVKDTHLETLEAWQKRPPVLQVRRQLEDLPGRRRPVVAIVDTGVADNPWFHDMPDGSHDPVLIDAKWWGWNGPSEADQSESWHGTFLAGLIRWRTPDARILSVAMRRGTDGRIASGEIFRALQWLQGLMSTPDPDRFVDVICLAVGFRIGSRGDSAYARQVGQSIHDVGECGSWLVAAAGNSAPGQADRVYPAALLADGDDLHLDDLPMVAVGALNDDGEPAAYGIHGPWAKYMYPGKGVSIVPGSVPASQGGEAEPVRDDAPRRPARHARAVPVDPRGGRRCRGLDAGGRPAADHRPGRTAPVSRQLRMPRSADRRGGARPGPGQHGAAQGHPASHAGGCLPVVRAIPGPGAPAAGGPPARRPAQRRCAAATSAATPGRA